MSIMTKLTRVVKPGMFTAVMVGAAIAMAATYTTKLAAEYNRALDEVETAKDELGAIETQRASLLLEIEGLGFHRNAVLDQLRSEVVSEVLARVNKDITGGAYDDAVTARMWDLTGGKGMEAETTDVNAQQ